MSRGFPVFLGIWLSSTAHIRNDQFYANRQTWFDFQYLCCSLRLHWSTTIWRPTTGWWLPHFTAHSGVSLHRGNSFSFIGHQREAKQFWSAAPRTSINQTLISTWCSLSQTHLLFFFPPQSYPPLRRCPRWCMRLLFLLRGYISYFCDLAENVTALGESQGKMKESRRRVRISSGRKRQTWLRNRFVPPQLAGFHRVHLRKLFNNIVSSIKLLQYEYTSGVLRCHSMCVFLRGDHPSLKLHFSLFTPERMQRSLSPSGTY